MKIRQTKFEEAKIFTPEVYYDDRGFFMESFNDEIHDELGEVYWPQDNHSKSHKGVLRGLHYQWAEPMGKLVRVVNGSGIDCIVDIRLNSDTFGQHEIFLLSENNQKILWVPPGFAHGFLSLEDNTHLCYRTNAKHNPDAEGAISPFDMQLDIDWGLDREQIMFSEKDKNAQSFDEYVNEPKF